MLKKLRLSSFKQFVDSGKLGGVLLLCCVLVSLSIANSGSAAAFERFLLNDVGFSTPSLQLNYSISSWINDGLMAVFFVLVGLEIKRELWEGELSNFKKAALPILAALGGMVVPSLLYYTINKGEDTAAGWGIPMATDIAFALAIISLLGKNVPTALKVFLAALAIVDDLGAILVIAIFYTNQIHWDYLMYAGLLFAFLLTLNYFKVRSLYLYLIPGIALWYVVHHSGIHATIAGVLLAFSIPLRRGQQASPLLKLEHGLNLPVNFVIMPLFALANTNITFQSKMFTGLFSPLSLGIILGLFIGKTIGISLFSAIAVKLKIATLPSNVSWNHIIGVGMLAGIGFTMSIFIALLSFEDQQHIIQAKFSVLCASLFSGLVGFVYLKTNQGSLSTPKKGDKDN